MILPTLQGKEVSKTNSFVHHIRSQVPFLGVCYVVMISVVVHNLYEKASGLGVFSIHIWLNALY